MSLRLQQVPPCDRRYGWDGSLLLQNRQRYVPLPRIRVAGPPPEGDGRTRNGGKTAAGTIGVSDLCRRRRPRMPPANRSIG